MDTYKKYEKHVSTGFLPAVDPLVIDRAEVAVYHGKDVTITHQHPRGRLVDS